MLVNSSDSHFTDSFLEKLFPAVTGCISLYQY